MKLCGSILSAVILLNGHVFGQIQEPRLSVTQNSIQVNAEQLDYKIVAGYLPLKKEDAEKTADIFFTYYVKQENNIGTRPITFAFNGGPGSPSCWLHLGALGPYRISLDESGNIPKPPYSFDPNENTWLDLTDLVFIDPCLVLK